MSSQDGKRTAKIIFGEFFVLEFFKKPEKVFTSQELAAAATEFGVNPANVSEVIKREFAGAIVYDGKGHYSLDKGWGVDGLLDAVNDQRNKVNIKPLELPKPNLKERMAS